MCAGMWVRGWGGWGGGARVVCRVLIPGHGLLCARLTLCAAQVMKGPLRDLFDASQLLTDVSGSGNNWGHGFCVYGPKYEEAILDQLHRAVEACDSPQVGEPYDSGFLDQVQGEGNHQHHQRGGGGLEAQEERAGTDCCCCCCCYLRRLGLSSANMEKAHACL